MSLGKEVNSFWQGEKKLVSLDDLFPVFQFVVIRARYIVSVLVDWLNGIVCSHYFTFMFVWFCGRCSEFLFVNNHLSMMFKVAKKIKLRLWSRNDHYVNNAFKNCAHYKPREIHLMTHSGFCKAFITFLSLSPK